MAVIGVPLPQPQGAVTSCSPEMRDLERALANISSTGVPVLLCGESGSGKGYFAARIHQTLLAHPGPLVKLHCASLDAGSLADFVNAQPRSANGYHSAPGTLVLDEVADLDAASQGLLVSLLPDGGSVVRFPDGHVLRSRLICTTRHNLEERYRAGRFREDLYFRISGVCLRIPPLRRRKSDIPLLLDFFLQKYSVEMSERAPAVAADVLRRMMDYDWPGNVRELENYARQMVLFGAAPALPQDAASAPPAAEAASGPGMSLKDAAREASRRAERELILKTLARTRWNRKRAAQELMISYKALLYKLKDISAEAAGREES